MALIELYRIAHVDGTIERNATMFDTMIALLRMSKGDNIKITLVEKAYMDKV